MKSDLHFASTPPVHRSYSHGQVRKQLLVGWHYCKYLPFSHDSISVLLSRVSQLPAFHACFLFLSSSQEYHLGPEVHGKSYSAKASNKLSPCGARKKCQQNAEQPFLNSIAGEAGRVQMEDAGKMRAHSVPSNYITLQQLQERRLREQKQREEEEEVEEERQRQLQKQREEEKKKKEKREKWHRKSAQTQRMKAAGCTEKKNSSGGIGTLAIEREIEGQEGEVENSNKGKKHIEKRKGKRSVRVEKAKREEGSAGSDHGEIVQKFASMNVSDHGKMDGVDGLGDKSTGGKRQAWRGRTLRRVTAVKGEKTAETNGSDGKEGNLGDARRRRYGRRKGAGRRPDRFDGPDGSDERSEEKSLRQIIEANHEKEAKIGSSADEADGKNGGSKIEPVRPTVVLDGSDGADERSAAENKGASPTKKPLVVAAEMGGKPYGSDGVHAGSTVKSRSYSDGRSWGGMRSGFFVEKRFVGRSAAKGQVWVRKEEPPEAPPVLPHRFGGPAAMAGVGGEVRTPKPRVYSRCRGYLT
ncbi:hypothetical protein ACLOJK_036005 [Asimina triloba]